MTIVYVGIDEETGLYKYQVADSDGAVVGYNLSATPPAGA